MLFGVGLIHYCSSVPLRRIATKKINGLCFAGHRSAEQAASFRTNAVIAQMFTQPTKMTRIRLRGNHDERHIAVALPQSADRVYAPAPKTGSQLSYHEVSAARVTVDGL